MPSSEDLPDSGIELGSPPLQVDSLPAELPGKPRGGASASPKDNFATSLFFRFISACYLKEEAFIYQSSSQ